MELAVSGYLLNEEMRLSEDAVSVPIMTPAPADPCVLLFWPRQKSLHWLGSWARHRKSFATNATLHLPHPHCSSEPSGERVPI